MGSNPTSPTIYALLCGGESEGSIEVCWASGPDFGRSLYHRSDMYVFDRTTMTRQELINAIVEATIDYVITQVKDGRSVGPASIDQQERELQNASRDRKSVV